MAKGEKYFSVNIDKELVEKLEIYLTNKNMSKKEFIICYVQKELDNLSNKGEFQFQNKPITPKKNLKNIAGYIDGNLVERFDNELKRIGSSRPKWVTTIIEYLIKNEDENLFEGENQYDIERIYDGNSKKRLQKKYDEKNKEKWYELKVSMDKNTLKYLEVYLSINNITKRKFIEKMIDEDYVRINQLGFVKDKKRYNRTKKIEKYFTAKIKKEYKEKIENIVNIKGINKKEWLLEKIEKILK